MKAFLAIFLFIILGFSMSAQNLDKNHNTKQRGSAIFIINNKIIGNTNILIKFLKNIYQA